MLNLFRWGQDSEGRERYIGIFDAGWVMYPMRRYCMTAGKELYHWKVEHGDPLPYHALTTRGTEEPERVPYGVHVWEETASYHHVQSLNNGTFGVLSWRLTDTDYTARLTTLSESPLLGDITTML